MTIDTDVYRQLGTQEAEIRSMNDKIEKIDRRLDGIEHTQAEILAKLNSVGGGWKAIVGMGMAIVGFVSLGREMFEIVGKFVK
jgi:hypothetical protein